VGGGDREGETQQLFFEPKANPRPLKACLAPKHNNQPHNNIRMMSNDLLVDEEPNETRSKQQSAK
jgi:hypothetical protein